MTLWSRLLVGSLVLQLSAAITRIPEEFNIEKDWDVKQKWTYLTFKTLFIWVGAKWIGLVSLGKPTKSPVGTPRCANECCAGIHGFHGMH